MYEFMSDKVGFINSVIEGRTFKYSLAVLKDEIDNGNPVVIGSLDMFYLEYLPKFYQQRHIPIHYVLVVGYDDTLGQIWVYDCSRDGLQKLSYENLEMAWNVNAEGLSKKNTLHKFSFQPSLNDVRNIFYTALEEKCKSNIYAPVNFVGVKGINKLAKDILTWEKQLDNETYKRCLLHLVEYAGFPPSLPDKINMPEARHTGVRLEFAGLLKWAANEYEQELFQLSAQSFEKSGQYIENLAYKILDIAKDKQQMTNEIKDILCEISSIELDAFKTLERVFQ